MVVAAGLAVVAGCSGDDDAVSSTTSAATTTEPPVTTSTSVEATTTAPTTAPATTVPEPTTTVPGSTTTSTPDPTTTTSPPDGIPPRVTFPDDPDKQAVVDAVYVFSELLFAAQADPMNEELRSQVEELTGEPVRTRFVEFLDRVAADGEAFVDDPDSRSYLQVFAPSVTAVDGVGLVDGCVVDRTIQIEVGGNADGTDRVIDDTVFSAAHSYSLSLMEQGWIVVDLTVFGEWEDQVGCGD